VATEVGDPGAVAFERALAEERRLNVRRLGLLRFMAVSVFFALFLLLGGALRIAYWQAPIPVFAGYWVVVGLSAWIARRVERLTSYAALELLTGRGKRSSWMLYLLAVLFLMRFFFLHRG